MSSGPVVHIIRSHKLYQAEYKYIADTCQQDRPKGVTSPPFQGLEVSDITVQSRGRLYCRWHIKHMMSQEHIRKETYVYSIGGETDD